MFDYTIWEHTTLGTTPYDPLLDDWPGGVSGDLATNHLKSVTLEEGMNMREKPNDRPNARTLDIGVDGDVMVTRVLPLGGTVSSDETLIRSCPLSSFIGEALISGRQSYDLFLEALYAENPHIVRAHLHFSGDASSVLDRIFATEPGRYYVLCREAALSSNKELNDAKSS